MKDLQKAVVDGKFDLGIAFDGDGDRLGIVDSTGYILYGDQLLLVFAREFLKTHKGEKVMSEVKASDSKIGSTLTDNTFSTFSSSASCAFSDIVTDGVMRAKSLND